MNDRQWESLLRVLRGERLRPLPTGFIIDSPWLPGWAGHTMIDYFVSERVWFDANLRAIEAFPETWLLPGFWSEYGMCTEPSAFGAVSRWEADDSVRQEGAPFGGGGRPTRAAGRPQGCLLPWVIQRLRRLEPEIERAGHKVRFAVARGPLNIASFLLAPPSSCSRSRQIRSGRTACSPW